MQTTVVDVAAAPGRARVGMSAGAGTVLVPRLLDRTAASARVALVAGGAMLLGGDHLGVSVTVGDGCALELIEVGGTVAYSSGGRESSWVVDVTLGAGATLLWHGRELVVADDADCVRRLTLALADGARALIRETTVLGRSGERGGRVRLVTDVSYRGEPLLAESVDWHGAYPVPGICGDHRVLDTVLLAGLAPADPAGGMTLDGPGALARHLGGDTHRSPMPRVWDTWRAELD